MVFRSHIKINETPPSKSISPNMASPTAVVESQNVQKPLHNFYLPDLKWAMNHTNTNRFRRPSESHCKLSQRSTVPDKPKEKLTDHHHNQNLNKNKSVVERKSRDALEKLAKEKFGGGVEAEELVKKPVAAAGVGSSSGDGSIKKLYIRIKTKSSRVTDEVAIANAGDQISVAPDNDSDDLLVPKTWNSRRRRLVRKTKINSNNVNQGGALKIGRAVAPEFNLPEKNEKEKEKRKGKDKDKEKEKEREKIKKEKTKFSISLKKEEIEDDFFVITGSKPPKRPKKRAKNVQKQLDVCLY